METTLWVPSIIIYGVRAVCLVLCKHWSSYYKYLLICAYKAEHSLLHVISTILRMCLTNMAVRRLSSSWDDRAMEREQAWYWSTRIQTLGWIKTSDPLQFYTQKLGFGPIFFTTGRVWERKCSNSYCLKVPLPAQDKANSLSSAHSQQPAANHNLLSCPMLPNIRSWKPLKVRTSLPYALEAAQVTLSPAAYLGNRTTKFKAHNGKYGLCADLWGVHLQEGIPEQNG